mmetsp:Transcript_77794/g.204271  ORF Transcript_77794/g.204271 Transcript_77794/m.204271 type:complete len:675 (-) Transcript_77794:3855-5879(-)
MVVRVDTVAGGVADQLRGHTVGPLTGDVVKGPIQLVLRDCLGVEDVHMRLLERRVWLRGVEQAAACSLQRAVATSLSTTRWSDEHHAVPHLNHVKEFELLLDEVVRRLQECLFCEILGRLLQPAVVHGRPLHAGEEVRDDVIKQRKVVTEELRHVHISQGSQEDLPLALVRVLPLVETCCLNHRLHSPHAVVVVALRGELLTAQLEGHNHLLRKVLALLEPEGVEADLTNHAVVRHHHRHRAEEGRQVVRELASACVPWVHRDEDIEGRLHLDHSTVELELRLVIVGGKLTLRAEQLQKLLRDHAQHLDVDAIELIEAAPRSARREALEELPHHEIVHLRGAIEDHALLGQSLRQVLGRLRLASACRARWRSSQVEALRAHKRHVAHVSERRDHKPEGVPEVLIAIGEGRLNHSNPEILGLAVVHLPVVAELGDPLERHAIRDILLGELLHGVASMHIDDHKSADAHALHLGDVAAHQANQVEQLLLAPRPVLVHGLVLDALLDLCRPVDLAGVEAHLPRIPEDPLGSWNLDIHLHPNLDHVSDSIKHCILSIRHPHFDVLARGRDVIHKVNDFTLLGMHLRGDKVLSEGQLLHSLKDLGQERLHPQRVFGLRQDLKQLIVGQEVEASERSALRLEVVVQPLLHEVKGVVCLLPVLEQPLCGALRKRMAIPVDA